MRDPERLKLFNDHLRLALFLASRIGRRTADIEDLAQEASSELWEATEQYDPVVHPETPFKAYARTRIRRRLIRVINADRPGGITEAPAELHRRQLDLDQEGDGSPGSDQVADAVWDAMDGMPAVMQQVLIRRAGLDGLAPWSLLQCADALQLSFASAKKLYAEARSHIAAELVSQGWNPARWRRAAVEETHIKVS